MSLTGLKCSDVKYGCLSVFPTTVFLVPAATTLSADSEVSGNIKKLETTAPCSKSSLLEQFSKISRVNSKIQLIAPIGYEPRAHPPFASTVSSTIASVLTRLAYGAKNCANRSKTSSQCLASHLPSFQSNLSLVSSASGRESSNSSLRVDNTRGLCGKEKRRKHTRGYAHRQSFTRTRYEKNAASSSIPRGG